MQLSKIKIIAFKEVWIIEIALVINQNSIKLKIPLF